MTIDKRQVRSYVAEDATKETRQEKGDLTTCSCMNFLVKVVFLRAERREEANDGFLVIGEL